MKIGILQNSAAWENKRESMAQIRDILEGQATAIDLLILPEMTLTGFTMHASAIAEPVPGESHSFFSLLAHDFNTAVIAGMVVREESDCYNCAVYFDKNGTEKASYRKIHPFSFAQENVYYSPGKETCIVHDDQGTSIGLSVCYDLRFPELYRVYAKERVQLIVNIANWPVQRISHWNALLKARAIENQSFVIGVNRRGADPLVSYNGNSMVIGPDGVIIEELGPDDSLKVVEIDLSAVTNTRERFPFLQDIRLI